MTVWVVVEERESGSTNGENHWIEGVYSTVPLAKAAINTWREGLCTVRGDNSGGEQSRHVFRDGGLDTFSCQYCGRGVGYSAHELDSVVS